MALIQVDKDIVSHFIDENGDKVKTPYSRPDTMGYRVVWNAKMLFKPV